jgi:hypothetical protein
VWQVVPQNSGELVYSQVVALTVTAVKVNTATMAKMTSQRIGRCKLNSQLVNLFKANFLLVEKHQMRANFLEVDAPSQTIIRSLIDDFVANSW